MNYRERFENAVQLKPVDRAPFDLEGTPMSKILSPRLWEELCSALGVRGEDRRERALQILDIDFRPVGGMPTPENSVARRISATRRVDFWGIEYALVGNDWQIVRNPLKGARMEDLDAFPWPDAARIRPTEIAIWRDAAKRLYEETDYVVAGEHPVYGILELGCWMCGFDDFLYRLAGEPEFVKRFFERVWRYQQDVIDLYYEQLGPYLHLTTSGDDFGAQNAPFLSPSMFADLVAPYYDSRIALTAQYTNAHFFHHSCGSIYPLIPRLIAAGVRILNPIQPNARDMEPDKLRDAYGSRLAFWGGIDTQQVLPGGTPEAVDAHVRAVLGAFGKEGGYVLAPAHCLQEDVPAQNIIQLFKTGHDYYGV